MTVQQRLHLLGPVRVELLTNTKNETAENEALRTRRGSPRFRSQRTIALLGYLAAEHRPVARSFLAALFWPDDELSKGRANLRRELHNLGNVLPGCWQLDRHAVEFTHSVNTDVDIYTLLDLETQEHWIEAADLLGGEFLEALYLDGNIEFENWLASERDRWRWRTETILTRVIEGHTRRGQYRDAIQLCQRLLKISPWKEEAHRQIMRLLTWTGQRGTALHQFESCKQILMSELGVEPSEETITLFQQIKTGELDLPPQLPAFLTAEKPRHEPNRPKIVAREQEMGELDSALKQAISGRGSVVFVSGGPGRGKTILMEAFARQAMKNYPNLLVASGNCNAFSGIGDPYLPFRDIMSLLTGDVETKWDTGSISREHAHRLWDSFPVVVDALLDHAPNVPGVLVPSSKLLSHVAIFELTSSSPRYSKLKGLINHQQNRTTEVDASHLYQQTTRMLQAIATQHPLLLILDDLQWADTASISMLFHISRRIVESGNKILILCALRPEEIPSNLKGERHPLAKLINETKRIFGNQWLDLTNIEESENRRFVDAILDTEPNKLPEHFRTALHQRTGGHPLFTVELLHAMQERGDLIKDAEGDWVEASTIDWNLLPTKVEAVIEERIQRLDSKLQETLTIASVEGETFTAEVVAKVQEIQTKILLRQLSMELGQQHRLVREQEELEIAHEYFSRYKFRHVLFRDFLYERISPGEKRILHGSVANSMEELLEGRLDEIAVQLASHLHKAGEYHRAFKYYIQAAERSARLYANDETITNYSQAIELARIVSPSETLLVNLYRERGRVYQLIGEFDLALNDFKTATELNEEIDDHLEVWRTLVDLGKLWSSRDYNLTKEYFEKALNLARSINSPEYLAESLNWIGNWHTNADEPQAAVMYHQEALSIVEKLNAPRELANTLDLLGITHLMGGNFKACIQNYDRSITLFRELEDQSRLVSSLTGKAATFSMLMFLGSVPTSSIQATHDLAEAIQIASEIGSASDEAWAHWASGVAHSVSGHFGKAVDHLEKGLQLATEIGHSEFIVGNLFALGALHIEQFDLDQALAHSKKSLDMAKSLDSRTLVNLSYGALAGAYLAQDNITLAQGYLGEVISNQTSMDTVGKRYCWVRQAEIALAQEDPELALDIVDRLISTAPGIEAGDVITYLWMLKGKAFSRLGSFDEAIAQMQVAIANARKTEEQFLLWRAHADLGHIYQSMDRPDEVEKEFTTARIIVEEIADAIPNGLTKDKFLIGAENILLLN